jgi:hypothetical protein
MSFYFLVSFLAVCIVADFIIIRIHALDKLKPERKLPIILTILYIPLLWLLMALDQRFHPVSNLFSISDRTLIGLSIKVVLAVAVILFLEVILYRLITGLANKKSKVGP